MKLTVFDNLAAETMKESGLKQKWFVTPYVAKCKADLKLLKLATFGDNANAKRCLRHDANVTSVTGAELDYDAGELSFDTAVERLERAGVNAILYTSPSHTRDSPRWRVLAPFEQAFTGTEAEMRLHRNAAVVHICEALGVAPTAESMRLSQAFYFGTVERDNYSCSIIRRQRCVDVLMDKTRQHVHEQIPDADVWSIARDCPPTGEVEEVLSWLDPDMDRDTWVKVGAALHHTFEGDEEGYEIFDHWSQGGQKYEGHEDTRTRWDSYMSRGNAIRFNSLCFMAQAAGANLGDIRRRHDGIEGSPEGGRLTLQGWRNPCL